ncbi:hypothetical protein [Streptomyces pini]|uniref:Uncharacterized protein n=1 Tax=Streptomyces pini TaxID=1520580 RepID=A0A1I4C290_9ACTN|nr:hypothetical protein [Streptomyces pini]SFK74903.1 hypothetical protein SAMN05192584_108219 [Streptomyces pini]
MAELTDAQLDELMEAIGLTPPKNRGGSKRKPIAHGTYRGARQHYYRREPLCEECRDAERAYQAERKTKQRHGRTGYLTEEEWQARRDAKGGAQ